MSEQMTTKHARILTIIMGAALVFTIVFGFATAYASIFDAEPLPMHEEEQLARTLNTMQNAADGIRIDGTDAKTIGRIEQIGAFDLYLMGRSDEYLARISHTDIAAVRAWRQSYGFLPKADMHSRDYLEWKAECRSRSIASE